MASGMHLRAVALGIFWLSLVGTSPQATPTVYRPTFAETLHRTLSDGVYGAPAGTTPAGEVVDGFALSLTANRYTFRFGEGLSFAVELRNVSNVAKSTPFSAQDVLYEFMAANKNSENGTEGQATPNFGPPAGYEFAPRTSLYLWFEPQVTDTMQEPGTFTVQAQVVVDGRRLVSNTVTLNILPSSDGRPIYASSDPSRSSPSGPANRTSL